MSTDFSIFVIVSSVNINRTFFLGSLWPACAHEHQAHIPNTVSTQSFVRLRGFIVFSTHPPRCRASGRLENYQTKEWRSKMRRHQIADLALNVLLWNRIFFQTTKSSVSWSKTWFHKRSKQEFIFHFWIIFFNYSSVLQQNVFKYDWNLFLKKGFRLKKVFYFKITTTFVSKMHSMSKENTSFLLW